MAPRSFALLASGGRINLEMEDDSGVLIDHASAKSADKRGGDRVQVTLDENLPGDTPDVLALDEALTRLEKEGARLAHVVKLRYLCGLTIEETAEALEVSKRTINDDWNYARAWLKREMRRDRGRPE